MSQKAEEVKGVISRKTASINFSDKQIQDNLKTIENTKNGIEIQKGKIKDAELKISAKQEEIKTIISNIDEQKAQLHKILEDMSGVSETTEKYLEKRNSLRKTLENYQDIKQELWITAIESFRKIEANSEVKFHQYLKRLNVVENMSVNE